MSDELKPAANPFAPSSGWERLHKAMSNPVRDYWDALDAYYRDIGMTDDDAHDDWRERVRKFRRP